MQRIAFIYRDISFQAPLGIMYLSAFLKKSGHECWLFLIERDNIKDLKEFRPDFLCYTVTTSNYKYYVEYNKYLRGRLNAMSLFGGPHATFFPEMINEDGVDGVCVGEGEQALLDLVSRIEQKKDYSDALNWTLKVDGRVVKNKCIRLEANIDNYPFPDRETFFKTPQLRRSKIWIFIGSRGCPFQCSYCHNHMMKSIYDNEYRVRYRSIANIMDEVSQVKKEFPLEMIMFTDDTFNLNKKWLKEFSQEYGKKFRIPYSCYIRADLMDEEVGEYLNQSNCRIAYMGIESGNERVRREILNRPMSNEQIVRAARILNKNKIKIVALNILGIPGTTFAEDLDTLKLNILCKPYQAVGQLLQPYPNTKIFDYSIKLNLFTASDISNLGDVFTDSKLSFNHKHLKQVIYLRDLFHLFVRFPPLFSLFPLFLIFPRKIFYYLAKVHYGYAKFRLFPLFNSPSEIWEALINYYNREKRGTS